MDIYEVKESGQNIQQLVNIWRKDAIKGIIEGLKKRPQRTLDLDCEEYKGCYISLGALSVSRFGIRRIIAFDADDDVNIENDYERTIYGKGFKVVDMNCETYYPSNFSVPDLIKIANAIIKANEYDHENQLV